MSRAGRPRRGLVLFAVLVIVGSAVLVATTVVFLVNGEVSGGANERETLRMRAAGLSAVQAIAARLGSQRSLMIEGGTPLIDAEITLWESDGETATARLVPVDATDALLVAENAKVPIAAATVESLVATGTMDEGLAGRVLALRDGGGRLLSIDALLTASGGADGLTATELFGPLDRLGASLSRDPRERRDRALDARVGTSDGGVPARDLLTALSYEPPIRADGSPRLDLDQEWTDDHRGGVDALLGTGSAALLEAAMKEGEPTLAGLFAVWRAKRPDPKEWHAFLDGVTLGEGPIEGRVDITRASLEALRALPGVTRETAERIVREREGLPVESRRSIAWLAERSILDADACTALVERATTRSFLWRFRVVATIVREREAQQQRSVVFEAVVDCSDPRPRLAVLRDLSGLDVIVSMLGNAGAESDGRSEAPAPLEGLEAFSRPEAAIEEFDADPEPEPLPETDESMEPTPESTGSGPAASDVPGRRGVGRWRRAQ